MGKVEETVCRSLQTHSVARETVSSFFYVTEGEAAQRARYEFCFICFISVLSAISAISFVLWNRRTTLHRSDEQSGCRSVVSGVFTRLFQIANREASEKNEVVLNTLNKIYLRKV